MERTNNLYRYVKRIEVLHIAALRYIGTYYYVNYVLAKINRARPIIILRVCTIYTNIYLYILRY